MTGTATPPAHESRVPADQGLAAARLFHDTYERLAPQFGYETREDTKQFDPESPNGRLMTAVCSEVLATFDQAVPSGVDGLMEADRVNQIARTLYECERERSNHVDRLLSSAKGQPLKYHMEHWNDVADTYRADARAVLATFDQAVPSAGKVRTIKCWTHEIRDMDCPECRSEDEPPCNGDNQ